MRGQGGRGLSPPPGGPGGTSAPSQRREGGLHLLPGGDRRAQCPRRQNPQRHGPAPGAAAGVSRAPLLMLPRNLLET